MKVYKQQQENPYQKQLISIARMAHYQPIASIPPISNDFNFTFDRNGAFVRKQQEKNQPSIPLQKERQNSPIKLPKIQKNSFQHHPTNASDNLDRFLTIDTRIDTDDFSHLKHSRGSLHKKIQSQPKGHQFYRYNKLYSNNKELQSDQQYSSDATPGPGYYSSNSSVFSGKKAEKDHKFGSKVQRFTYFRENPKNQISYEYSPEIKKQRKLGPLKKKKIIPFLSGSLKKQKQKLEYFPGPQDYSPRNGIEEELIRKIQRNFKGNFGVCSNRFEKDKNSNLGPGCYHIQTPSSENKGSHYFAKNQRFNA